MLAKLTLIVLALAGTLFASDISHAQDVRTGMFRLSQTTTDIGGTQLAQNISADIPIGEVLQWQVYVPEGYQRQRPPGVFVFANPNGWGGMPDEYRSIFNKHNLIWIGTNANERNPSARKRLWSAILASSALEGDYLLDLSRMYAGSTGDGAQTALNLLLSANQHSGAIFIKGSHYWSGGMPAGIDTLRRKHFVFVSGTNDKAKASVRKDYNRYRKDGISNVKLIFDMERLGKMPDPEQMDEAIRYLDSRLQ
jgi:hypothetical protein